MAGFSVQDSFILEKVTDPTSEEFTKLMTLLLTNPVESDSTPNTLTKSGDFRYVLPYRGDPEDEAQLRDITPFRFSERGEFRNGISSLSLALADLLDLVSLSSNKKKTTPTVCVSAESNTLLDIVSSAGPPPPLVFFSQPQDFLDKSLQVSPTTIVFDHTTVCTPLDELLNVCYRLGIKVVDGVFPYHVAASRGWDVVSGLGKWSYTHDGRYVSVGPADDTSRVLCYDRSDYAKFLDPNKWTGNARKYGYELRKAQGGLVTYRAVYLGDDAYTTWTEKLAFNLPVCSSDDMVLVSVNRELAAGVFVSQSNNAQELARLDKNYCIEVRRDLFVQCVDFLIAKDKGSDIVGDAVRYITSHNYVDLVDGIRIIRCPSLSYADALCVSMVCALTAFDLRYRLTNDSLVDIKRFVAASHELTNPTFGSIERLAWFMWDYVSNAVGKVAMRSSLRAKHALYGSEFIPGVCYDVYMTTSYSPDLEWYEPAHLVLEPAPEVFQSGQVQSDPLMNFIAEATKTSASTAIRDTESLENHNAVSENPYIPNVVEDPINVIQTVYDEAFPGNSTAQLQNVAELRKVRDIDFHTEFFGKIEINKDVVTNERLHQDASIRTAALPVAQTSLVDAILASAKRNFNPPDLQMENDPWVYARYLADRFEKFAFGEQFMDSLAKSYKKDPITFNVVDYLEWKATRDQSYRSALEAECPQEIVELNLEKFDTIVKKRIKPKLSTSAQFELSQPQVIVSLSKRDTAPFTSVFRKMFERFEAALRPEIASAGRMSDDDITRWLTSHTVMLQALQAIEIDSSKYDKSQGLLARMVEALILIDLGLDPGVSQIFEDSYVGKVSSKALGLMFISAYQMKSGAPQTMLGNIIYNMVSAMECIGPQNIKRMIAKGDDNLVWIVSGLDVSSIVYKMSSLFNLEAKLVQGFPWYFSSGYVVIVEDGIRFVPDPLKAAELMGERGQSFDTVHERFISFQDRVRSFVSHNQVPAALQKVVRIRMGLPTLDVVGLVDAFSVVASDYSLFVRLVSE